MALWVTRDVVVVLMHPFLWRAFDPAVSRRMKSAKTQVHGQDALNAKTSLPETDVHHGC